jgi:GxxExxY protein
MNEFDELDVIGKRIVHAAYLVHSALGPGLLEKVYELCLLHELKKGGLRGENQVCVPIRYDSLDIEEGLRIDILVESRIVIELKAVEQLLPVHQAQVLTYLKLTRLRLGYLINFNVPLIKNGIHRYIL